MVTFLYSIVSVVVVLGIMILVHEFGHFAAAKFFGVRVEVFSIGFGKRLFGVYEGKFSTGPLLEEQGQPQRPIASQSDFATPAARAFPIRKVGSTDYRISALPLGGYVKMAGENIVDTRTGSPDEFVSHPRWQRLIIAFAGPAMNILLAVVLLTAVFMVHYEHPIFLNKPAVIGWVMENSPAAKAGLEVGDHITAVGSINNPTWEDLIARTVISPGQPLRLTVQRGAQVLHTTVTPDTVGRDEIGSAGWIPEQPLIVTALESDMPGIKAGLKLDDEILAVNGTRVQSTSSLKRLLQETKSAPVELTILRDGHQIKLKVAPAFDSDQKEYRIGFASEPTQVDKLPFGKALSRSIDQNEKNSMLILELVKRMVEHKVSIKQMEGPIGIARVSGEVAQQQGWTPLLALISNISLNLGIFNLFPIPILDGGLILLLLIESLIRRDISQTFKERIYQAAFVCLVLFAGLVIFNDVMKVLPGITHHIQ